jgi:hypothetical protein
MMKESPIFTKTYDLLCWLLPETIKFPRQHRFVLAEAVQRAALLFQEQIIEAGMVEKPLPLLRQADVTLAKLRLDLRLCRELGLLKFNQYEHGSRMVDEVGRLLGGWMKSVDGKR